MDWRTPNWRLTSMSTHWSESSVPRVYVVNWPWAFWSLAVKRTLGCGRFALMRAPIRYASSGMSMPLGFSSAGRPATSSAMGLSAKSSLNQATSIRVSGSTAIIS